jgi:hypothetical protein
MVRQWGPVGCNDEGQIIGLHGIAKAMDCGAIGGTFCAFAPAFGL